MSRAYYNENDHKAAAWLRELIRQGLIADGDVDERSIADVQPTDLVGYTQCHFFAGIGGWSYALRLAGWPDDRQVWTGSCPCQPFSCAGKGEGTADHRHLWPEFARLIGECKPAICFGEQVASKAGREWLAGVRTDLEAMAYRVGAADLCAAGVGAPHIRQRLYWVADANGGLAGNGHVQPGREHGQQPQDGLVVDRMANPQRAAAEPGRIADQPGEGVAAEGAGASTELGRCGVSGGLGDTPSRGQRIDGGTPGSCGHADESGAVVGPARLDNPLLSRLEGHAGDGDNGRGGGKNETGSTAATGPWSDYYIVHCRDGKTRRVGTGVAPLAHGVPARVVRLRGYGNAIIPYLASEFIQACEEAHEQQLTPAPVPARRA
jgi:DNA (cytosine-5)-methyltransferase 1